ncbi:hypothetical protein [Phenylobacterium sp.]|uniref:hypothetical protein n=1 Tax=Phenylobacterium sp. TaxID=1871053 RepID=UPI00391CEB38
MWRRASRAAPLPPSYTTSRDTTPVTPEPVDLRLIIEEDQASGSYVYKTVNRRTGEVVLQLPRAEVLRMREEADYAAGSVIRTKA